MHQDILHFNYTFQYSNQLLKIMRIKNTFYIICTGLVTLMAVHCFAQGTAINTNGAAADQSALLDVSGNQQGVLIPRMSELQRNSIVQPATSLLVFQTDGSLPGYYYNAGTPALPRWLMLTSTQQVQLNALNYAASSGPVNAYSVTLDPSPQAYMPGLSLIFKANLANSSATTLDVNGLGPMPVKKQVSSDLAANDILQDQISLVVYDGTNFQLINQPSVTQSGGLSSVNVSSAASWQSPTTNNNVWEDVTTLTYTIPGAGLYHVICSYESQDGSGGTEQLQRLVCGSIIGDNDRVGPWQTGYQYRTLDNLVNLNTGEIIKLQNYNQWNYCCKNTIRNLMFSVIKLN
jgi:hypothetical protein